MFPVTLCVSDKRIIYNYDSEIRVNCVYRSSQIARPSLDVLYPAVEKLGTFYISRDSLGIHTFCVYNNLTLNQVKLHVVLSLSFF
jgi:hypothetical protein